MNTYDGKAYDDIIITCTHTTHEYINTHNTLENTNIKRHTFRVRDCGF